jgi:N6-L-threonylcarbamoyladenine synthase
VGADSIRQQSVETLVLGIETSCDETAAAVVARDASGRGRILSNVIRAQWETHRIYGGVVPELAARSHVECLDHAIREAMRQAGVAWRDLGAVAATSGPGLIGGLIAGLTTAKAIALARDLPLIAVNHLEAHALTVGLTDGVQPPYLLLLVSGGHTQLLVVDGIGHYQRLATTIDDALGEAFDKTAKLLGLGAPGGPAVERTAASGRADRFSFPRPMAGRPEPHFSFSGLKTAVRRQAAALAPLTPQDVADLCAAFQAAATDSVLDRTRRGLHVAGVRKLVIAGGVAANARLRAGLLELAREAGCNLFAPPPALCTDNAAMVAWTGAERLARGLTDPLDVPARARWPLDTGVVPALGSGRLGAKA